MAIIPTDTHESNDRFFNADLHCHSTCSDGQLTPGQLIERAVNNGVSMLAITDHDTQQAYAALNVPENGLELVTGIELSATWNGVGVHVVGLGFDTELMQSVVEIQSARRMERAERIAVLLDKKGVDSALESALVLSDGNPPGRPHFARVLIDQGIYPNAGQAFKKFLGSGKPGDVKSHWPEVGQIVDYIHQANGIAVLAHPHKYKMTNSKLRRLLDDFTEAGGRGLEVSGTGVDSNRRQFLARLCSEYNLLGSRGSDFHSPGQTWCDLGKIAALPADVEPIWNHLKVFN